MHAAVFDSTINTASVATFSLEDANHALEAVKHETADGSAVIIV